MKLYIEKFMEKPQNLNNNKKINLHKKINFITSKILNYINKLIYYNLSEN